MAGDRKADRNMRKNPPMASSRAKLDALAAADRGNKKSIRAKKSSDLVTRKVRATIGDRPPGVYYEKSPGVWEQREEKPAPAKKAVPREPGNMDSEGIKYFFKGDYKAAQDAFHIGDFVNETKKRKLK